MMMGIREVSRIFWQVENPSISESMTSKITSEGDVWGKGANASSPLPAQATR
jgi:hypothetical protein